MVRCFGFGKFSCATQHLRPAVPITAKQVASKKESGSIIKSSDATRAKAFACSQRVGALLTSLYHVRVKPHEITPSLNDSARLRLNTEFNNKIYSDLTV